MKKMIISALSMIFATSVFAGAPATDGDYNPFPWDFPSAQKIEANTGDWALSCMSSYPSSVASKKDLTKSILIYYSGKISSVSEDSVSFSQYGQTVTMPSSLVIPIPAGQKAKKGDLVLTWWQSGSGMNRAVVVDDANPSEPKVCYLDLDWRGDGTGIAERKQDELKPNSFVVLKKEGEWKPGQQIALKGGNHETGTILAVTKDKVLYHGFADKICAAKRDDCVLVPFNEKIKVGDSVSVRWLSGFRTGYTVVEVDKAHGRYKCKEDKDDSAKYYSFFEVTKVLK